MYQPFFAFFRGVFAAFFCAGSTLCATDIPATPDTTAPSRQRSSLLLGVFAAPVFGIAAPEFAREYEHIGDTPFLFDSPLALGATTKIPLGKFRIGAAVEAYRARFQDNYRQNATRVDAFGDTIQGFRGIYQDFNIKALPVFATIEIAPVISQFRTYAGAGIGIAYTEIFWGETVSRSNPADTRTGGVHVEEQRIAPAFRLYTGVELGFDRTEDDSPLHSLFVEVRYSVIPASLPLLQNIASQIETAPASWQDNFSVRIGGFAIAAGLTLQFAR